MIPDQEGIAAGSDRRPGAREIGHIKQEMELKLMLLRHWSLFDSIQNSTYTVSKLNLAKEPGQ